MSHQCKQLFSLRPGASLVLASASPRRRELLHSLGLPFAVRAPQAEEEPPAPGEKPIAYARRMALLKGLSLVGERDAEIIIAADTVVSCGSEIFGKPRDEAEALTMLLRLNGRTHQVITAVYAHLSNPSLFHVETTVSFGRFSTAILERYARSGDPMDKAGSYAIQGLGSFLVSGISGSHSNVIGLPLEQLVQELLKNGILI